MKDSKASITGMVKNKKSDVARTGATLEALSPVAVLSRGYSITRTIPDKKIIIKESEVMLGQLVETILASGRIVSKVEERGIMTKKNFEQSMKDLEKIVEELESGEIPVSEKALKKFEDGIKLSNFCAKTLDETKQNYNADPNT